MSKWKVSSYVLCYLRHLQGPPLHSLLHHTGTCIDIGGGIDIRVRFRGKSEQVYSCQSLI